MAAQEIITLLEGTPQLMTPQTGNTYTAPRTMTITPETNTGALILTGGSVTVSSPLISATQTWNAGAVAFSGITVNITDTASLITSAFADFKIAGTSLIQFVKTGHISFPNGGFVTDSTPGIGPWGTGLALFGGAGGGGAACILNATDSTFSTNVYVVAATKRVGYGVGAGGAVTQITSRTTGVTLNTPTGAITMFSAAGSAVAASFTVTNSVVIATDTIVLSVKSATNKYQYFVTAVAAGSFEITFMTTGGVATDAPVVNFAIVAGVVT